MEIFVSIPRLTPHPHPTAKIPLLGFSESLGCILRTEAQTNPRPGPDSADTAQGSGADAEILGMVGGVPGAPAGPRTCDSKLMPNSPLLSASFVPQSECFPQVSLSQWQQEPTWVFCKSK